MLQSNFDIEPIFQTFIYTCAFYVPFLKISDVINIDANMKQYFPQKVSTVFTI